MLCWSRAPQRVFAKCYARLELLRSVGHELGRPVSAQLRNGIHELRVRDGRAQVHILYFGARVRVALVPDHG